MLIDFFLLVILSGNDIFFLCRFFARSNVPHDVPWFFSNITNTEPCSLLFVELIPLYHIVELLLLIYQFINHFH